MEFTSNNLTFVIVTFNSRKVIDDCLNSLPKNFHKLIIENSSDKELKKELEQNYDKTKVVLSKNIGMGAGNNLGIAKSNTQYVYVLNPDVVLQSDTLSKINISISNLENFAILSPVSDNLGYPNYRTIKKKRESGYNGIENVEEIDGYSMIINKEYFSDNIFFDENFFMYLENVDLCLRAKKNNGRLFVIKNSKIHHLGSKAVDDRYSKEVEYSRNWHWMWSKFYFNKKHYGYMTAVFRVFKNLISAKMKFLYYLITLNTFKRKIYQMRLLGLMSSMKGKKSYYRPNL